MSTEKTTEKSFKDDEPNSSPQIDLDYTNWHGPKDNNVLSSDNNEDESTSGSSVQSTITTPENVGKTSTQAFDEYLEEESSKFPNSVKEIKWIPITSTNSTDKIVNYVSSVSTQITDSSTPTKEKATEMSFKRDEPNSLPRAFIHIDDSDGPQPKIKNVIKSTLIIKITFEWSSDDNEDECSRESSVQQTKMTLGNVSGMPNEEFDEYPGEESSKSPNSEKKIKSMPTTSTNSTDKIVRYFSTTITQITNSSTPTTEKSESESSTTDNTNASTTTENMLNGTDDINNLPRNFEDREDSKDTSSVVSSSTISSSVENYSFENEVVSNSLEFISPEVSYAANDIDVSSSNDEEKEAKSDDQEIGRKDKETHSSLNVTDYSTQKITENIESERSSTDMTNTPTTTENTLNYASNVKVASNGTTDRESYDINNYKKRGVLVGSGSTGSFFVNLTLNFCVFLGDLLFLINHSRKNTSF